MQIPNAIRAIACLFLDGSRKSSSPNPITWPVLFRVKYSVSKRRRICTKKQSASCAALRRAHANHIFTLTHTSYCLTCNVCDVIAKQILGVIRNFAVHREIVACSLVGARGCWESWICASVRVSALLMEIHSVIRYNDKNLNISACNLLSLASLEWTMWTLMLIYTAQIFFHELFDYSMGLTSICSKGESTIFMYGLRLRETNQFASKQFTCQRQ